MNSIGLDQTNMLMCNVHIYISTFGQDKMNINYILRWCPFLIISLQRTVQRNIST